MMDSLGACLGHQTKIHTDWVHGNEGERCLFVIAYWGVQYSMYDFLEL